MLCLSGFEGPSSLQQSGRDSCLREVLCYKRLFTRACVECKRFFLKRRKTVMFLNKIYSPYCLVVFFNLLFARVSDRFEAFSAS